MATNTRLTRDETVQIGIEAYVYFYPLVTMEITRRQASAGRTGVRAGRGPMNAFHHIRAYPAADFRDVVRPNFDTLYSLAWLDLSAEPMIVSAPAAGDRFFMLPCYDMWTDVFAAPGTRTSGPEPFSFALSAPGWHGSLPDGVEHIPAPTPTVWIIGRVQANGPADYPAVRAFQDRLTAGPLSSWGGAPPEPQPVDDPSVDPDTEPLRQVNRMPAADYFALAAELAAVHPPHLTDWSQLARLRRIGLVAGQPFDLRQQPELVREALAEVPRAAQAELLRTLPRTAPVVNGWLHNIDTMGVYGDHYAKRAVVATVGLGANHPEDAVYPVLQADADGKPLDGSNRYLLHFGAGELPPVDAFWSITMYDAEGFHAANEIDRFAIGDRDPLRFNPDGSLDIAIQHDNPGPDRVANWLPAPPGPLGVTMRLYLPRKQVFTGEWLPPPVRSVG
ncbi:DUF1254 domain-containing protein [Paractinoplanes deccanensis]|nr:DUF1254 domain-containing protein [Actinoplanes deccanensis]